MKEDVVAQIKESKTRSTSLLNDCVAMLRLKTISFPPTDQGLKDKKKYEERIQKVVTMIEEYKKYSTMEMYRDLYKEYLEKLKEEEDSKRFHSIYLDWEGELLKIKFDAVSKHQELTTELRSLIMYVRDKKREEYNAMSESTNYTVEMYTEHADEIKRVIYEKCNRGDITLEQREILLNRLNDYRLSTESCEDLLIRSMNEYMSDEITAEELDNVLVGCYQENASVTRELFGDDITDRYNGLYEAVHQMYRAGYYTKKQGRAMLERVEDAYEKEHNDRISEFLETTDVDDNAITERAERLAPVTAFMHMAIENADTESENFYESVDEIFTEFCDDIDAIYSTMEPMYEVSEAGAFIAFLAGYFTTLAALIAIPTGVVKGVAKSRFKKFTKYFESMNEVPIPMSEIKIKSVSVTDILDKFPTTVKRMVENSTSNSNATGADAKVGVYNGKNVCAMICVNGITPFEVFEKSMEPYKEYYKTCFCLKAYSVMSPDCKDYFKKCMKEAKKKQKEVGITDDALKEANKTAANIVKEYTDMDPSESSMMYEKVLNKIYRMYNEGALDFEKKEALIMEAREKFFEAAVEGKSKDECMKIAREMITRYGSVDAALKANDESYKAIMNECQEKMQECKKDGNKECYDIYYKKRVLASKDAYEIDQCLKSLAKEEKKKNSAFSKLKNKISGKASTPSGRPVPATESGCEEEAANCFDVFRNGEERSSSMRSVDRPKENCFDAFRNGEGRSSTKKERERKPGVSWDYENRDKEKKKENCFDVFKTGKKEESCDGGSGCRSDSSVVEEMPDDTLSKKMSRLPDQIESIPDPMTLDEDRRREEEEEKQRRLQNAQNLYLSFHGANMLKNAFDD